MRPRLFCGVMGTGLVFTLAGLLAPIGEWWVACYVAAGVCLGYGMGIFEQDIGR